jgi:hypothetical protein
VSQKKVNSDVLSAISDSFGNIRLAKIRDYLTHPKQSDVDFMQEVFLKWVTSPEALLLQGGSKPTFLSSCHDLTPLHSQVHTEKDPEPSKRAWNLGLELFERRICSIKSDNSDLKARLAEYDCLW